MPENYACADCGQIVKPLEYHPHLFCVLWKAGIRDQAAYLEASGWQRIVLSVAPGVEESPE